MGMETDCIHSRLHTPTHQHTPCSHASLMTYRFISVTNKVDAFTLGLCGHSWKTQTLTLAVNDLEAWIARNTLERANRVHTLLPRTPKPILTLVHIWAARKRRTHVLEVNVWRSEWRIIHRSGGYMTKSIWTPGHRAHLLYHSSKLLNCCRKAEGTHLSRATFYAAVLHLFFTGTKRPSHVPAWTCAQSQLH